MNSKSKLTTLFIVLTMASVACIGGTAAVSTDVLPENTTQSEARSAAPAAQGSLVSDVSFTNTARLSYPIVGTMQTYCYGDSGSIPCPEEGEAFSGQDGNYSGLESAYLDNGDGTITDLNTGLMWQKDPGDKMTFDEAVAGADSFSLAGYDDWRLPTIKELYSLIQFSGTDPSSDDHTGLVPFIDDDYFVFTYGDATDERVIDSQFASSTTYVGGNDLSGAGQMFGVNFADGRIKGYGYGGNNPNGDKLFYVLYVRGNSSYGINDFVDNNNGTITDNATGLTWMQDDSNVSMDWEDALSYCENLSFADHDDWRLPDAKELQSIVDYSRSPDSTGSATIDPLFSSTQITAENGNLDYPYYWTSTTHVSQRGTSDRGVYIAFGEALGYMNNSYVDVHGAGAQRSDPKSGDSSSLPLGMGPQGDIQRSDNFSRCVSGGEYETFSGGDADPYTGIGTTGAPSGEAPQSQNGQPQGQAPGNQPPEGGPGSRPNGRPQGNG
jgi:hypothetical protein